MIIFQSIENFCGFLYFVMLAAGIVILVVLSIVEGWREMKKYTEEEQSLIDGVEFALDNRLDVSDEDVAEYHRLTEERQQDEKSNQIDTFAEYISNKEFRDYVDRYLRNKDTPLSEVLQYKQMQLVAQMYREESEVVKS